MSRKKLRRCDVSKRRNKIVVSLSVIIFVLFVLVFDGVLDLGPPIGTVDQVSVHGTSEDDTIDFAGDGTAYLNGVVYMPRVNCKSDYVIVYGYSGDDNIDAGSCNGIEIHGDDGDDYILGANGVATIPHGSSNFDSLIYGGEGDDVIYGGEIDDMIFGDNGLSGGGDDVIYGMDGDDSIDGDEGHDQLYGGDGNDYIYGHFGNDQLFGGDGDDRLGGGKGHDSISGDAGDDSIEGGEGDDSISGDAGNDWIEGGEGDDSISGDAGNDRIYGESGNDQLFGGDGDDWIEGGVGDDYIRGGKDNDRGYGGDGNDFICLDSGEDYGEGNGDADILSGGPDRYLAGSGISGDDQGHKDILLGDSEDFAVVGDLLLHPKNQDEIINTRLMTWDVILNRWVCNENLGCNGHVDGFDNNHLYQSEINRVCELGISGNPTTDLE